MEGLSSQSSQPSDVDTEEALAALGACEDFECIRKAHGILAGKTPFNFPHYFLIGWQKCATTSINVHLRLHPQYLPSTIKESHYWSTCRDWANHPTCRASNVSVYIKDFLRRGDAVASGLTRVSTDTSVDYAWRADLAQVIHEALPWIKIVMVLREPLSRLISYTRMYTEREDAAKGCLNGRSMYTCLRYKHLDPRGTNSNYSVPLAAWLAAFPDEQIHVIQFEELQESPDEIAFRLKQFLGLDTSKPQKRLYNTNARKVSGGYDMRKDEYLDLVNQVRWDALNVAKLLSDRGLVDRETWIQRWEAVWRRNLDACSETDGCRINSN